MKYSSLLFLSFLIFNVKSDPDPNFYIFLAFGQSNMEGKGPIEEQDKTVDERFQMMAAIDFPKAGREQGKWYPAAPPLCRDDSQISPSDYFGRQLVEILPQNVKVGIINVAIAGCKIDMFDEDKVEEYLKTVPDWMKKIALMYNNNPFRVLMNRAKEAQKEGIIKGIIMHQGEANRGDPEWPKNVKIVFDRMLNELGLDANKTPLLAGEVVRKEYGGNSAIHNEIIKLLPETIKNSYVISAEGLPPQEDKSHFTTASYRTFGRRYGVQMLRIILSNEKQKKVPYYRKFLANYLDEEYLYYLDLLNEIMKKIYQE